VSQRRRWQGEHVQHAVGLVPLELLLGIRRRLGLDAEADQAQDQEQGRIRVSPPRDIPRQLLGISAVERRPAASRSPQWAARASGPAAVLAIWYYPPAVAAGVVRPAWRNVEERGWRIDYREHTAITLPCNATIWCDMAGVRITICPASERIDGGAWEAPEGGFGVVLTEEFPV
jgi:hypothetical protein